MCRCSTGRGQFFDLTFPHLISSCQPIFLSLHVRSDSADRAWPVCMSICPKPSVSTFLPTPTICPSALIHPWLALLRHELCHMLRVQAVGRGNKLNLNTHLQGFGRLSPHLLGNDITAEIFVYEIFAHWRYSHFLKFQRPCISPTNYHWIQKQFK